MRLNIQIIFLFSFLLWSFTSCSQEIKVAENALMEKDLTSAQIDSIYDYIKSLPNNTQLSIAIIKNAAPTFYGLIRNNDTLRNIDNKNQAFEIGSLSKVFTSQVLSQAVIANKIQLDDNINAQYDFPFNDDIQLKYKQLSTHTSGLPRLPSNLNLIFADPSDPYKEYDEAKLIEYLKEKLKLEYEPGSISEYSNVAAGLLGYTLGRIYGKNYEELIQEKMLGPLGMTRSSTDLSKVSDYLVKGVNEKGEEVSNWDLNVLAGAGGIKSTAEDMAKFAIANLNTEDTIIALTHQTHFSMDEERAWGLGWAKLIKENNQYWLSHNGGTGGYTSSIHINPATENGVIILSNITALGKSNGKIMQLAVLLMDSIEN